MAIRLVPNNDKSNADVTKRNGPSISRLIPNNDRLTAEKQIPREVFEARAFQVIEELDHVYFHGAAHVTAVKLAHFATDYRYDGMVITLGCFNSDTNVIYLNRHIKTLVEMGQNIDDFQAVLWHELCHAVLLNAHQAVRHGNYKPCGGDHGEDFWKLADQHTLLSVLLRNGAIERMSQRIYFRMSLEGKIKNAAEKSAETAEILDKLRELFEAGSGDGVSVDFEPREPSGCGGDGI